MTSRDVFIAQLIAALQENEAAAGSSQAQRSAHSDDGSFFAWGPVEEERSASSAPTISMARAAYERLQYDFPMLEDGHVVALANMYRSIADGNVGVGEARQLALTAKMLEGLEFLTDATSKQRGTEATALLAIALLLIVPKHCIENPTSDVVAALLKELRPPGGTPVTHERTLDHKPTNDEAFSDGFVEVYAAEEDPDDLSLVYEGELCTAHTSVPLWPAQPSESSSTAPDRVEQLRYLASKTFSTSFSLVTSEKWTEWGVDTLLCDLILAMVTHKDMTIDTQDPVSFFGGTGEWQRYLFVLRDQLLRLVSDNTVCTSGLQQLRRLVDAWYHTPPATQSPPPRAAAGDPFFSFGQPQTTPSAKDTTTPLRVVFRVLAEFAVSKEFNAVSARQSQHTLAVSIQQLFPVLLRQLQQLAMLASTPAFASDHGDVLVMLLQMLHFVVAQAGTTTTSQRMLIDKLHDSGILRAWLAFVPAAPTGSPHELPWVTPLLRLFGESALWSGEFAAYVHRVPKVSTLLTTTQHSDNEDQPLACESLLLAIAAYEHQCSPLAPADGRQLWGRLASERMFPSSCLSFLEAMHKMADALFLVDVLGKAVSVLRATVADQLRTALQSVYSTRFATAFQYPGFMLTTTDAAASSSSPSSLSKYEPEPPPGADANSSLRDEEDQDDDDGKGHAEALQFVALRNRLRQSLKAVLLSRVTAASASKLD